MNRTAMRSTRGTRAKRVSPGLASGRSAARGARVDWQRRRPLLWRNGALDKGPSQTKLEIVERQEQLARGTGAPLIDPSDTPRLRRTTLDTRVDRCGDT